ncbi:MAG: hypothetical protein C5B45_01530, partial [Chlamydiae bacterium]
MFPEEFIKNWHHDPNSKEKFLREHSIPMEFASFDDTLRNLAKEEGISLEQFAYMSRFPVTLSCRIIGKQKEVSKTDNLFVIGGEV